jgi:IS5 family transposase
MRYGLIKKVAVTAANVPDFAVVQSIAPRTGTVFMDKMYDTKKTDRILSARGLHASTLRKNTNPQKNHDLDRWRSSIRMPFESTFSKQSKFARYRSHAKVTFQCFFEALVYNLKKAVRILKSDFGDSGCLRGT